MGKAENDLIDYARTVVSNQSIFQFFTLAIVFNRSEIVEMKLRHFITASVTDAASKLISTDICTFSSSNNNESFQKEMYNILERICAASKIASGDSSYFHSSTCPPDFPSKSPTSNLILPLVNGDPSLFIKIYDYRDRSDSPLRRRPDIYQLLYEQNIFPLKPIIPTQT